MLHLETRQLVLRFQQSSLAAELAGLDKKWSHCAEKVGRSHRTAELQGKIGEMRAKNSVLNTPKRERAARRATEPGVVSLAGGYRCAWLRNTRCSGRSSRCRYRPADSLQMGVAVWSQCLGPCPHFPQRSKHPAQRRSASRVRLVRSGKCMPCEATPPTRTSFKDRKLTCAKYQACSTTRLTPMISGADGDDGRSTASLAT